MQQMSENDRAIVRWLLLCLALIFSMVVLGGVTRLTGSGLSMVNWHPHGVLPPSSSEQWLAEFELYKQFPEYQKLNQHLTVEGFKSIFGRLYSPGVVHPCEILIKFESLLTHSFTERQNESPISFSIKEL